MPPAPLTITKQKLLLGEGVDEARFFKALLTHLQITDVQVVEYGGKTRLAAFLQTLTTPLPGFSQLNTLAVTRDADDNCTAAFQSACHALKNAGLSAPAAQGHISGTNPTVHVLILPDNQNTGMLEDLCLRAVQTDPATPCVDAYFQYVAKQAGRQPSPLAKARLHAWLASQLEPDKRLGEAAEKGYWPWGATAFQSLTQFLQSL